ncbi:twin-arginine translocase TatA/TatE family subunit [Kribbella sp. NPDC055071]
MVPQLELPQGGEWIVILVIVVLLFGAKKLPELTKNAAKALNEFNKARNDDDKPEVTQAQAPAAQPAPAAPPTPATDSERPSTP